MTRLGGFGVPGVGADLTTSEAELLWGSDLGRMLAIRKSGLIQGETRDAGNTPTTVLRPGLVLAKVSGEYTDYDPDATDGSEVAEAILAEEIRAQDFDANNADRVFGVIVGGLIRGGQLNGLDEQARRQLLGSGRFLFDDDLVGRSGFCGAPYTNEYIDATGGITPTLVIGDCGKRKIYGGGTVNVTLPTLATAANLGFICKIMMTTDHELVITAAPADTMIAINDMSADTLTFTTAGEQIGLSLTIESLIVNTTAKWLVTYDNVPFGTGYTGGPTLAIAT